MKAVVYTKYGPPDILQLKEVEKPTPKDNEVLIKIHATTVNRTDCGFLRAKPWIVRFFSGLFKPKNTILGNEFAGEIIKTGKNVTDFRVGDKVFGYDDVKFGGHAEYKVMSSSSMIATIPLKMTYKEAAPILEGAHYSLYYIRASKISKDTRVLIYGATGAIGSAGVQIIKQLGAHVTAVCGSKNVKLVKQLGADKAIDYEKEDFTKISQRFDVVFDAVGKSSFGKCKTILKPGGVYTSSELGRLAQNPILGLLSKIFGRVPGQKGKKALFPIPKNRSEDVRFLKELVEQGKFKPVIDRTYTFDEIVKAYKYVEKGQKTGNVVIRVR